MKPDEAQIVAVDGQEHVETEDGRYGLGLQFPDVKTQAFPTLATRFDLLTREEIRKKIESSAFGFGRKWFDDSWLTNQNGWGSCAGYAVATAAGKAGVMGGLPRVDLSGDYAYSRTNGGKDRGSMLDDNMRSAMVNGIAPASLVKRGQIFRNKYDTAKADREARKFRGHELFACPDEQSVATALVMQMPVVIAIHCGPNWRKLDGDVLRGDPGPGNHSEHLDDIRYNAHKGRFEFREGSSHNRPYFWTYWDRHFAQPSRNHQFYAVPGLIDRDGPADGEPEPEPQTAVLTVKSSRGCVWCDRWEARERHKVVAEGIEITSGDVPGSGVPRFRLEAGGQEEIHVGYWAAADIARAVARMTP